MEKQAYKVGDIFCFSITENEFGFGRILLDIDKGIKAKKIPGDSYLNFGRKGNLLIELYAQTSEKKEFDPSNIEVLVPGLFTSHTLIQIFKWEIIDHLEVDPITLEFPESFGPFNPRKAMYTRGEIGYEIEMPYAEADQIKILQSQLGGSAIPGIVLYHLGRKEEISIPNKELRNMANFDLRFSENRDQILAHLPDELKGSYHEVATSQGLDPARLL